MLKSESGVSGLHPENLLILFHFCYASKTAVAIPTILNMIFIELHRNTGQTTKPWNFEKKIEDLKCSLFRFF
jgi:hypothetical protein